jgi:hypothetical protein
VIISPSTAKLRNRSAMPPDPHPVADLPAPPSARPITEFAPEPNFVIVSSGRQWAASCVFAGGLAQAH